MPKGVKNPVGCPLKYTPEFISNQADKILVYVKECLDKKLPIHLNRFSYLQGYAAQRISDFAKSGNEKFLEAYNCLKSAQEYDLFEGALTNRYDSGFAFRALKNVSGWRDEQHVKSEHTERKVILIKDERAVGETENSGREHRVSATPLLTDKVS